MVGDADYMAGNRYYIFSISTVMVVAHMQFMVSGAGHDYVLVLIVTWDDAGRNTKRLNLCAHHELDDHASLYVDGGWVFMASFRT
jgi:hypothetical protein